MSRDYSSRAGRVQACRPGDGCNAAGSGYHPARMTHGFSSRLRLAAAPVAAAATVAVSNLTMEQIRAWGLPGATAVTEERHRVTKDDASRLTAEAEVRVPAGEVVLHRGADGTNVVGYVYITDEMGRDDPITFAVAFLPDGAVRGVEVMTYRSHYGGGIRDRAFLDQFRGRRDAQGLEVGDGVDAVSGATISSKAASRAVRRAIALFRHAHPPASE